MYGLMAEKGIEAGNEIARDIVSHRDQSGKRIISKYRLAKDLQVTEQCVYNWIKGVSSPTQENYDRLRQYSIYVDRIRKIPKFK